MSVDDDVLMPPRRMTRAEIARKASQAALAKRRERAIPALERWRRTQPLGPSGRPSIIAFTTDVLGLSLSPAQATLLKSLYGEPLTEEEFEIFRQCTGRKDYPAQEFGEATIISGARSGKDSRFVVPVTTYDLAFGDHAARLAPGEPTR